DQRRRLARRPRVPERGLQRSQVPAVLAGRVDGGDRRRKARSEARRRSPVDLHVAERQHADVQVRAQHREERALQPVRFLLPDRESARGHRLRAPGDRRGSAHRRAVKPPSAPISYQHPPCAAWYKGPVPRIRVSFVRWDHDLRNRTWPLRLRADLAMEEGRAARPRTTELLAASRTLYDATPTPAP